jgi:CRP-like cAMP-binding protein
MYAAAQMSGAKAGWMSGGQFGGERVPTENHLIAKLPRENRLHLLQHCEPIELVFNELIGQLGDRSQHAYFPRTGFISLLPPLKTHAGLDVGLVGDEGMFGVCVALGVAVPPLQGLVRGAGSAWRIKAEPFRREIHRSAPLRSMLNRYICVLMRQLALTAVCTHFHLAEQRLARWLLMAADRAHADSIQMTHEFLAQLLGIRRVGVTHAASALRKRGMIEYRRGDIKILDRSGLEAVSCGCYAATRQVYSQILK